MNAQKLALILAQLLLVLLCVLPGVPGRAATSSYYLDTSRLELQVNPQTHTASGAIKVNSNSDKAIRLKVLPRQWHLSPEGVVVYDTQPDASGFQLTDNIRVNPEEFDLLPGKSRLVRFIVKVPPQPQNGEYPFQLYFEPTSLLMPASGSQASGVSNVLDVIPVFTTTVYAYQGTPTPAPKIEQFACGYQPDHNQVRVDLSLNNAGTKHARLFGNLILNLKKPNGEIQFLEVMHLQNSTLLVVFPNTPRVVRNDLNLANNQKLEPGQYQAELRLVDERNVQPALQSDCTFTVTKP